MISWQTPCGEMCGKCLSAALKEPTHESFFNSLRKVVERAVVPGMASGDEVVLRFRPRTDCVAQRFRVFVCCSCLQKPTFSGEFVELGRDGSGPILAGSRCRPKQTSFHGRCIDDFVTEQDLALDIMHNMLGLLGREIDSVVADLLCNQRRNLFGEIYVYIHIYIYIYIYI